MYYSLNKVKKKSDLAMVACTTYKWTQHGHTPQMNQMMYLSLGTRATVSDV